MSACRAKPKLRGPDRGVYHDLHVVLDMVSRRVVSWTVAASEHADRGTSMTYSRSPRLLVDLGVARSHSRTQVSLGAALLSVSRPRSAPCGSDAKGRLALRVLHDSR